MLKTYDRYLLSQLLTLFGFFSIVLVAVYWVNRAVSLFDQLVANGHSAMVFVEFSILALPNVIRVVLPVAAFAASVYVINRMRGDSELVVVNAAGLSPVRGGRAVLVFGVLAALLAGLLTHALTPMSVARLDQRGNEVAQDVTAGLLSDGQFIHPTDDVTVFIAEITDRGELLQVFLSDRRSEGSETTYTAERAVLVRRDNGTFLVMFEGLAQTFDLASRRLATTRFDDFAFDISSMAEFDADAPRDIDAIPSIEILRTPEAAISETGLAPTRVGLILHERTVAALQCLVAPILGFAAMMLGGFSRFSAWRQVTLAIVSLVAFELAQRVALDLVYGGVPWTLLYLVPASFAALAAAFLMLSGRRRRRPGKAVPA